MKVIFVALLAVLVSGCTSKDGAERALKGAGYTEIEIGGYAFFACDGKSDTFATSFTAKGPTGMRVSGAVCSGFLKGSTIRLD